MTVLPHGDRAKLLSRLQSFGRGLDTPFSGELFRFVNPGYSMSDEIVSGAGALHSHGRWHPKGGMPVTYASLSCRTALEEAMAQVHYSSLPLSHALPRVLVSLTLKADRSLELRSGMIRSRLRLATRTMRKTDWAENQGGQEAITQAWGSAFANAGFEAVIVPSYPHA